MKSTQLFALSALAILMCLNVRAFAQLIASRLTPITLKLKKSCSRNTITSQPKKRLPIRSLRSPSTSGATAGFFCAFSFVFFSQSAYATASSIEPLATQPAPKPNQAAIASAHPLATQAGLDTLKQGGNAFDAAITVAAVLGVVEPYSAGLGGGGFWLLHTAKDKKTVMVDAREKAPMAATPTLYLDPDTQTVIRDQAINGATSAGIPGQPAALVHLAEHYGNLPLKETLKPAIELAKNGFPVDRVYLRLLQYRLEVMQRYPETRAIFLKDNQPPQLNDTIVQRNLAKTLRFLAKKGHAGFYSGPVAKELIRSVQAAGGIWEPFDLEAYQVIERAPIVGQYKGNTIVSASPPSSGGILLVQMLNMLEAFDLESMDAVEQVHLIAEVMRRAYRTRSLWLGDEDFVLIPKDRLLNTVFSKKQMASFNQNKSTPSTTLLTSEEQEHLNAQPTKGLHTTHFSVLDREGNRVSATLSINLPFGSGFVAGKTGVLLNDEMDDFDAAPGSPNAYGLIGSGANAIAPGKRPLSSMSPTFIENEHSISILGTPGGSRIITMVLLGILEATSNKPVSDWVSRKRFHHQFFPDQIQHEPDTFTEAEKEQLNKLGHELKNINRRYGNMHAIHWDLSNGEITAASDPRGIGQADTL